MKILSYSPGVAAYACVFGEGGSRTYYDLTQDIVSCSVTRNVDTNSTFTITLANRKHKYNGLFSPMDAVTIFADKNGERTQLITGYMTNVTKFTLYEENFVVQGKDTLYRLQQLLFDPGLEGTYELFANESNTNVTWAGYVGYIRKLVCTVGGWNQAEVSVGELPDSVMNWARKLYEAQQSDLADSLKIVSDFYDVLKSVSTTLSSTASASGSSGTASASDAGLTAGQTVDIPSQYGGGGYTVTCYDSFDGEWSRSTNQYQVNLLWHSTGAAYTNGIATINGRYLCACTYKFGSVGDRITFFLDDGTRIPCLMADEKRANNASEGSNEWGHSHGANVLEFEVLSTYYHKYGNPGCSSWFPEWHGKRVAKATNFGSAL